MDSWRIACLRNINIVGAHQSSHNGEKALGINILFPILSKVTRARRTQLQVLGGDWPTPNGTGVRDYIQVVGLAEGRRADQDCLLAGAPQLLTLNLGRSQGRSYLKMRQAMEAASNRSISHAITYRRPSDAAISGTYPRPTDQRLVWQTQRALVDICRNGMAWQQQNPEGYA